MRRFFPSTIRQLGAGGLDIININFQNSPNGVGGFNGVDFCEGSGLWTISGERSTGGRIYHSSNGTSWTLSTYISDRNYMRPANDGNNSVLSSRNTGGNRQSTNQTSWSAITVSSNQWGEVIFGGGVWLMKNSASSNVARSTNRTTWVEITGTGMTAARLPFAFDGSNFVICQDSAGIYTSTDLGITWTQTKTGSVSELYNTIDYGNGIFMSFSSSNLITISLNGGITWSTPISGPLIDTSGNNFRLCFGGGVWVFMSDNTTSGNNFWYSRNDGATWSPAPVTVPVQIWRDLHYSESQQKFIAVADSIFPNDVIMEIILG